MPYVFHQFVDDQGTPVPDVTWTLLGPGSGGQIASGSTSDDGNVGNPVPAPGGHTIQYDLELGTGDEGGGGADIAAENYDL